MPVAGQTHGLPRGTIIFEFDSASDTAFGIGSIDCCGQRRGRFLCSKQFFGRRGSDGRAASAAAMTALASIAAQVARTNLLIFMVIQVSLAALDKSFMIRAA